MVAVALLNDFTHFHGCVSRPKELMTITYPAIRYILQTFINKGLALKDAEDFAAAACGLAAGAFMERRAPCPCVAIAEDRCGGGTVLSGEK